ncbi:wax ester/triacylglycerol synthase family O-acyltransferase [Novosphingobium sp. Gsoil 351]|uniref:WS/DGAT/MGAT family O-acyltransferase n=1 Tax=Novosphingobium sp. Gsoil 351 TaxID=2675225 RepID=UPI0012B4B0CE|nr:wax ester/triacylglycerol synthase family O-acyltransferase [Novosphingobium sp. Gsoil 351]QGN56216.1 wax ester/triacylglycerol synthase family O-acyltransferase [Novosphingobium sp. Gsoil 351]
MDHSFVALETRTSPMHIGSLLIYNPATAPGGFVRFKDILAFYETRLQLSKTVRQRMVRVPFDLDYPYWIEDEDFDLEFHVRHVALPQPGDWRQLCIQAARIFSRPLDLTRPPWEFTVIEGLGNILGIAPGSFAMVTKVHHAAIDGMSGIDLMEALHTLEPHTAPPNRPDEWKPEKIPGTGELLARAWLNAIKNPFQQLNVAARSTPGLYRLLQGVMGKNFEMGGEMIAPKSRFNTTISAHRVVEGHSFPLNDIKAIRALAPGCKLNDVFLAIIGGGLRRYLLSKDDLPEKSMTAMAPISVRSGEEKGDMGNQVAAMIVQLGTQIEDPAERLAYVHDKTRNSKAMTEAIGARNMTEMSKASPALFMALGAQLYTRLGLANRMTPPFNTVVTNVPGPPVPLYSAGARLESMMGLICLNDGLGLAHVVQSYVDEATISFTADRDLLPDPQFYIGCLVESFEELLAAAKALPPPVEKPAPKPKPSATAAKRGTKSAGRRSPTTKPAKTTKPGSKKTA